MSKAANNKPQAPPPPPTTTTTTTTTKRNANKCTKRSCGKLRCVQCNLGFVVLQTATVGGSQVGNTGAQEAVKTPSHSSTQIQYQKRVCTCQVARYKQPARLSSLWTVDQKKRATQQSHFLHLTNESMRNVGFREPTTTSKFN